MSQDAAPASPSPSDLSLAGHANDLVINRSAREQIEAVIPDLPAIPAGGTKLTASNERWLEDQLRECERQCPTELNLEIFTSCEAERARNDRIISTLNSELRARKRRQADLKALKPYHDRWIILYHERRNARKLRKHDRDFLAKKRAEQRDKLRARQLAEEAAENAAALQYDDDEHDLYDPADGA